MANELVEQVHLTPRETANRLHIHIGTLANKRSKGDPGPRYIRFGGKVLYPLTEIIAFEQSCLRTSTKEGA
jgi:hypothetical protein